MNMYDDPVPAFAQRTDWDMDYVTAGQPSRILSGTIMYMVVPAPSFRITLAIVEVMDHEVVLKSEDFRV